MFNPIVRRPVHRGRLARREDITQSQARAIAAQIVSDLALSPRAEHLVDALSIAGVLSLSQIHGVTGLSPRTLRDLAGRHILDRVEIPHKNPLLDERVAYVLGKVGLEIVKINSTGLVPTGYATTNGGAQRIEHDLLVSEIALRLSRFFGELGYTPLWRSKYQATIHDENNAPALEPDAMLSLTRGDGKYIHFFVEYHNEDFGTRAANKIERYERVRADGRWKRELEIDAFPVVLVVFRHKAVIDGYKGALSDMNGNPRADVRCTYLGTALAAIQEYKLARWGDIRLSKPTYLVPEAETAG